MRPGAGWFYQGPRDRYYVLILNSYDGSKLSLNERPLIDNDGMHGAWSPKDFMVPLSVAFTPSGSNIFSAAVVPS